MELVNVTYNGPGAPSENLTLKDRNLIISNFINSSFGNSNDYIELYVYGENGNILLSDYDATDYYPFLNNNPKNNTYSSITLDPEKDARNRGFNRGKVTLQYNFYKKLFNSQFGTYYWIKEISNSRTELKLASQVLSDSVIRQGFDDYRAYISSKNYYPVFYLNFGNNTTIVANNVAYTEDDNGSYILVKLYEPLPNEYDIKSELWIVDKVAQSVSFDVNIQVDTEEVDTSIKLRGPNYNVKLNTKNGQTTPFYTYDYLINNAITSSFQKLSSYYQDRGVEINVDYSNFKNFVHFSSAVERVNNFVYKLELIESASANILSQQSIVNGSSTVISQSITAEQKIIDNIITNFDVYEYFLYFQSSSWAWPKINSTQPYQLYSITSSEARNFLGSDNTIPTATTASLLFSASYYDSTNKDLFHNSIPQYLLDDPANQPYITFLDMIGQHFDNIWIYYKDITNRFNSTNNPNAGISMDLVGEALKGLGLKLYTNSNVSDNLYYSLFGINPDGSLLPPTGSELITNYVTSSLQTLSANTIQQEIYKRLYHNIPYLYKTKGTLQGIKALISIYGIPETILSVKEFGGNYTGSLDGIIDLNSSEYKVTISTGSNGSVTGSLTISSSLLSPYTTIQYYESNNRLNNSNLEIGFSPADVINNNITGSLTSLNLDQLIGSPAFQYSSSYAPLVSASNAYFTSYTQPNSIWEYIRLLKFYNNSLFKIIKDFVPARANVSTGIIVKSHMLERNRYARHEPSVTFNDYSQSIEMLEVSADNGGALTGSTSWSGFVLTPLGLASYSSSQAMEKYNGELSGSEITVTDGQAMEQREYSNTITGSYGELIQLGALYQNISSSVKSQFLIDLDYNSDQIIPVNYNAVTYSISQSFVNYYETYNNPNNPFAQVQDYNYFLQRSIIPRYRGSSIFSSQYNDYTPGDNSYGKTATIDKIKYQYAYIVDIYSSSFKMPYRSQGQIKYLIDNNQNVINLSKTNTNWFNVQNVFKTGEYADVSLFDYNNNNPYIQKLNNSQNDFTIWESGYSYSPLLYNPGTSLTYTLNSPALSGGSEGTATTYTTIVNGQENYWDGFSTRIENPGGVGNSIYLQITASQVDITLTAPDTSSAAVIIKWYGTFSGETYPQSAPTAFHTSNIPSGTREPYKERIPIAISQGGTGYYDNWTDGSTSTLITVIQEQVISPGIPATPSTYTTSSIETDTRWFLVDQNTVKISASQSRYYGQFTPSGSYQGLDSFVFPFSASVYDLIRFYNSGSQKWDSSGEFRIASVDAQYSDETGSFVAFTLDRNVDTVFTDSGINSASAYPIAISKYILLKRLQDETSIYFNYNLPEPITEDGTLFPQYIGEGIKENSGNVIKALKQQNLI